jgi:hypothetical protein
MCKTIQFCTTLKINAIFILAAQDTYKCKEKAAGAENFRDDTVLTFT